MNRVQKALGGGRGHRNLTPRKERPLKSKLTRTSTAISTARYRYPLTLLTLSRLAVYLSTFFSRATDISSVVNGRIVSGLWWPRTGWLGPTLLQVY